MGSQLLDLALRLTLAPIGRPLLRPAKKRGLGWAAPEVVSHMKGLILPGGTQAQTQAKAALGTCIQNGGTL